MKKYLFEIQSALQKLREVSEPSKLLPATYIGSEYKYFEHYNICVPKLRALGRQGFSFSEFPVNEQWRIWDYVWLNSTVFDLSLMAMHFANQRPVEDLYAHRKKILRWIKRIDNWALSDEYSNILAKLYEYDFDEFKEVFKKWNQSPNPWERRASMVGLQYYARFRKKHVPYKTIINMVHPHLTDPHYYVQKAVGWTLRECWNVYPKKTYEYLLENAHLIPAGGWTAATEKLSKIDKSRLTKLRKKNR